MTRSNPHAWFRLRTLAATALCVATTSGLAQAAVDFNPRISTPFSGSAAGLAAADMTGDGVVDLVAAGDAGVTVLRGTGGGAYAPGAVATIGAESFTVAVGDFNGDAKVDAATASSKAGTVSVLLGDGNGGFGAPATIAVGQEPFSIAAGDLNADGKLDLAVANFKSQNVSLLVGNGDGSFVSSLVAVGAGAPTAVAIGDVTADGPADLVVTSGGVRVLPGPWNGSTFGTPLQISSKLGPQVLAVADMNRDGKLDIVSGNAANNVSVFISLGGSGFQTLPPQPVSNGPIAVVVGDVNADTIPDVAVSNLNSQDVSVLEGVGDGSVRAGKQFLAGRFPSGLATADVTGDGRSDLLVGSFAGSVAMLAARASTPGVRSTAKVRVPCRTPRKVVLGQELGCIRLAMSPAQVRELLGAPRSIVQRPRDREYWFSYGRIVVIFDADFNTVTAVASDRPGLGLANGVRIGAPDAIVKRRYPKASCRSPRAGVRVCTVPSGRFAETIFVSRGGKIVEIDVALR